MLEVDRVAKVSKDIRAELLIFTEDQKTTTFSEPDKNGFRTIVVNDGQKVKGILWGSWAEVAPLKSYCFQCSSDIGISCQPEVEIGHKLVTMIPIPSYHQLKYVMISEKPVKSIIVKRR